METRSDYSLFGKAGQEPQTLTVASLRCLGEAPRTNVRLRLFSDKGKSGVIYEIETDDSWLVKFARTKKTQELIDKEFQVG